VQDPKNQVYLCRDERCDFPGGGWPVDFGDY